MIKLNAIAEDLFAKIRGRFPSVTIGNQEGAVTHEPSEARFFEFDFKEKDKTLGKISISLDEQNGVTVMYNTNVVADEDSITKDNWYEFLRELRQFSKKRMLNFNTRNLTKSNLEKRDYQYLAKKSTGDDNMNESKLYGTSRISYQNVGEARILIKHTESINQESAIGRTQKIGKIYIESADGERFKYPFKHLSGARAMARHVSEGGKPFDDFGTHITGLSEEMSKLRKFKTYMGRSAVMAESLEGYMDIVKERISTVKKTIENLQKSNYYAETFAAFEKPILEDVPTDVAESWIDELTIKQFNEELADVFPYIYHLVKEGTKARALGPDDLDESGLQYYTGVKKHGAEYMKKAAQAGREGASQEELGRLKDKYSKAEKQTKEEFELEQAFEDTMGQFADSVCEDCGNPSWRTFTESEKQKGLDGKACWKGYRRQGTKMKGGRRVDNCVKVSEADLDEAYIKTSKDAIDTLGALRKIGKSIERGQGSYEGNLANMYANDVYDVMSWVENNLDTNDAKFKQVIEPVIALRKKAKSMEREPGSGKDARFGNEIVNTLYPLMQWIEIKAMDTKGEGNEFAKKVRDMKAAGAKKGDKFKTSDGEEHVLEDDKTPLGEFILSYFDRQSGQFPKGETAILTMIEKDYGEEFIEPAKAFIEQVNSLVAERFGFREPNIQEGPFKGLGKMMMKRKLKKDMSTHDDEMDDILDIGGTDDEFANAYDQRARKKKALSRLSRESNNTEIQNISRLAGV
jgi:hypothetical protein